ncbi:hypothetical protein [Saccharopolyspora rhizosphaerae]|uniref:hypothetical protein n=1 Tax=Saccharopolyspora rhizosphaerae TaxID=2492662 RepID=UPI00131567BD|nr:hypothetical protein [Saccharopolyspora rhizosphaerae]
MTMELRSTGALGHARAAGCGALAERPGRRRAQPARESADHFRTTHVTVNGS